MIDYSKLVHKITDILNEMDIKKNYTIPKVSIVIPAFNNEAYIARCLFFLIKQTLKEIEIIIVDDGSTDNTYSIASIFADKDARVKLIQQENAGPSKARNEGLKLARGEYIAFVDSDDWVDENFIETLYNSITKNNCDIAATTIIRQREKSQKYRVFYTEEKVYSTLQEKLDACKIPVCCYVWNKLYKADLVKKHTFKEGVYFEDVLWLPEVVKDCDKLVTVPNTNYYYWVNNNSIVKKTTAKKREDSYNSKKYIIEFFNQNGLKLSKKAQILPIKTIYLGNIPIIKIKKYKNQITMYLFGVLPFFKKKDNNNA